MWLSETSCMIIIIIVYSIVGFSTYKIRKTLRENDKRRAKKESKRMIFKQFVKIERVFQENYEVLTQFTKIILVIYRLKTI